MKDFGLNTTDYCGTNPKINISTHCIIILSFPQLWLCSLEGKNSLWQDTVQLFLPGFSPTVFTVKLKRMRAAEEAPGIHLEYILLCLCNSAQMRRWGEVSMGSWEFGQKAGVMIKSVKGQLGNLQQKGKNVMQWDKKVTFLLMATCLLVSR